MKFVRASGVPSGELQEPAKAQRGGKVQSGEPHIPSGTEPSVNGRNPGRVSAWGHHQGDGVESRHAAESYMRNVNG